MPPGLRNLLIILVLAAPLAFAPGGATTTDVILQVLSIAFLAGLVLLAFRLYQEHRVALFTLEDRVRALLYGSAAALTLALVGVRELTSTGPGLLVFFALIVGAVIGVVTVVRTAREF